MRKKLAEEILIQLTKRSKRALNIARKEIASMKVESEDGRKALEHYPANWNDCTHP